MIREHYYISGRVQGVGFRYRAYYTAQALGVTGYVKNMWDGRVELELQGEAFAVHEFLDRVEAGSFIEIHGIERYDMEVQPDEREFTIESGSSY